MTKVNIGPNSYMVLVKAEDCGTGAGGFKPGNSCAEGRGGAGTAEKEKPKTERQRRKEEQREARTQKQKAEIDKKLKSMDDQGIEANSNAFGKVDTSQENLDRYNNYSNEENAVRYLGGPAPGDPREMLLTDEAKARYIKAYDEVSEYTGTWDEYDKLMTLTPEGEDRLSGDILNQMDAASNEISEVLVGAERHLLEQGIHVDGSDMRDFVVQYVRDDIFAQHQRSRFGDNSRTTLDVSGYTATAASAVATYVSIADAKSIIEDRYRSSGADLPDFSDTKFVVAHEKSTNDDGRPTREATALSGGAMGYYNSTTGNVTIDAADYNRVSRPGWLKGSGGNGAMGFVVHEIGHALHHRKLMETADTSTKGPDYTSGKTKFPSFGFHSLAESRTKVARNQANLSESEWRDKWSSTFRKVGDYGATNEKEFVAEAFAMKVLRPDVWDELDDVRELYDLLEGP